MREQHTRMKSAFARAPNFIVNNPEHGSMLLQDACMQLLSVQPGEPDVS